MTFDIEGRLKRFYGKSNRYLENETKLICKVEHVGPKAYLIKLYGKLAESDLLKFRQSSGLTIPAGYQEFLRHYNGMSLFSDQLALYGIRRNYKRDGDDIYQPYDLVLPNQKERIKESKETDFYIGSYKSDGSKVLIEADTGKIVHCERYSRKCTREWKDFESYLSDEIERLSKEYDDDGRKLT